MKVLIVNHDKIACGTFQFCKRIWNIVADEDIAYTECKNKTDYLNEIKYLNPEYVIWNWHKDRIDWLLESDVQGGRKHYFLFHDGSVFSKYDKYIFSGEMPNYPTPIPAEKSILLPRPLVNYNGSYPTNDVPTIGSFGFATDHKRFPELVSLVNRTFDKAHVRLHITSPYFGVTEGYNLPKIVNRCKANNTNPNVKLTIYTNFIDDQELLTFLAGNDINVFYYEYLQNPGISSATDYALSVKRPIAVTKNNLFRHIAIDDILMEQNSLQQIIDKGTSPLNKFYQDWNPHKFHQQFNEMFI